MTPLLNQYGDKQFHVEGRKGTYKIVTNFLARTQPKWYDEVQNRLHVVEIKNNECKDSTTIIFNLPEKNEHGLADIMEDIKSLLE